MEKNSVPSVVGAWDSPKNLGKSQNHEHTDQTGSPCENPVDGGFPGGNRWLPIDQATARGALREHIECGH